jgi:hypothetical protein
MTHDPKTERPRWTRPELVRAGTIADVAKRNGNEAATTGGGQGLKVS